MFVLLLAVPHAVVASIGKPRLAFVPSSNDRHDREVIATSMVLNPVVANLVAGSVAGAFGCGLAHPLDTLKTRAQVSTGSKAPLSASGSQIAQYQSYSMSPSPNGLMMSNMEATLPLVDDSYPNTFDLSYTFAEQETQQSKPNMWKVGANLYQQEGLQGFFAGVQTMMVGQAVIRAVSFTTNAAVIDYLQRFGELDSSTIMVLAAFSAGVTSSFVVTPIERIKVLMQSNPDAYSDELQCIQAVLEKDGLIGLLTRGLGISLLREVPSVGLSFVIYATMMQMGMASMLGSVAPLVFGAISGSASCFPVYPVDCVKTSIQNVEGGDDEPNAAKSPVEIAQDLYDSRGIGGFVDGLTPKLLRCGVLSAASFSVYETILSILYNSSSTAVELLEK